MANIATSRLLLERARGRRAVGRGREAEVERSECPPRTRLSNKTDGASRTAARLGPEMIWLGACRAIFGIHVSVRGFISSTRPLGRTSTLRAMIPHARFGCDGLRTCLPTGRAMRSAACRPMELDFLLSMTSSKRFIGSHRARPLRMRRNGRPRFRVLSSPARLGNDVCGPQVLAHAHQVRPRALHAITERREKRIHRRSELTG